MVRRQALQEPHYTCPVQTLSGTAWLRSDAYGKGFFGASRSNHRRHKGIDLLQAVGRPVLASKSGRVLFSDFEKGYGLVIYLLHPDGLSTRYAHLSVIEVRKGDWVSRGAQIGRIGKTGNAAGDGIQPHLHFEIRSENGALNPNRDLLDPSVQFLSNASQKR